MKSYHNTNNESGATLKQSNRKAFTQEQTIQSIFKGLKSTNKQGMTAEELHRMDELSCFPITSIRRALTNLTSKKWNYFLVKSDVMRKGSYGKLIHSYKINK